MAGLKRVGVVADDPGQVGRLALPPLLLVCAAALAGPVSAASATALSLPPGADTPPVLPAGVKPADAPVHATTPQAPSSAGQLLPFGKAVASASAATSEPWATVNICDTEKTPNGLGVRASMPGNGRDQLMFMRFIAQYWSPSRSAWISVPGGGTSRWVYAGSARFAARQTGWTFFFDQPPAGTTFVMRAVVEQQWRAEASGTRALKRGAKKQAARKNAAKKRAIKKRSAKKGAARKLAARKHAAKRGAKKRGQAALSQARGRATRSQEACGEGQAAVQAQGGRAAQAGRPSPPCKRQAGASGRRQVRDAAHQDRLRRSGRRGPGGHLEGHVPHLVVATR